VGCIAHTLPLAPITGLENKKIFSYTGAVTLKKGTNLHRILLPRKISFKQTHFIYKNQMVIFIDQNGTFVVCYRRDQPHNEKSCN
jgi:hypothetical protein